MIALHERYLGRSVALAVFATWVVLTGFATLGPLINEIDNFGQGDYGLGHALLYVFLQIPRRAYDALPMAAVIGAVLALGGHAARSELVAFRAAGLAPARIAATALAVVLAFTLPMAAVVETLVPGLEQHAKAMRLAAMKHEVTLAGGANVWAREGSEVFNARGGERRVVEGRTVLVFGVVTVYAFDPQGRLAWIQEAAEAEYDEERGWRLRDVKRTTFAARSVAVETFDEQAWATDLRPGAIEASLQNPNHLGARAIGVRIEQLKRNGLDAGVLSEAYWSRWLFPLTTLSLVFAALPFAFGQRRSGGFGQRLFIGIVFALVARLVQPMLANLAKAYQWPIIVALLLPILVLAAIGAYGFRRR